MAIVLTRRAKRILDEAEGGGKNDVDYLEIVYLEIEVLRGIVQKLRSPMSSPVSLLRLLLYLSFTGSPEGIFTSTFRTFWSDFRSGRLTDSGRVRVT